MGGIPVHGREVGIRGSLRALWTKILLSFHELWYYNSIFLPCLSYSWCLHEKQHDSCVRFLSCRYCLQRGKISSSSWPSNTNSRNHVLTFQTLRVTSKCWTFLSTRCAQPGFPRTLLDIKEPLQLPGVPAAVLATGGISVSGMIPGEALLFVGICTAPAQSSFMSLPVASACSLLLCH